MDYRLSLSNAYVTLWGFMPVINYTHTDRYSNLTLYGYARDRVELGFSRAF
ncbi:MAG: surface lipoprotein assembly modifier [Candidatus Binataceae bacterium]